MIADIMIELIPNMKLTPEEAKHAKKLVKLYTPRTTKSDDAEIRKAIELQIYNFGNTKLKGVT